jgi:hypothetical protein
MSPFLRQLMNYWTFVRAWATTLTEQFTYRIRNHFPLTDLNFHRKWLAANTMWVFRVGLNLIHCCFWNSGNHSSKAELGRLIRPNLLREFAHKADFLQQPSTSDLAMMCSSRWAAVEIGELLKPDAFIRSNAELPKTQLSIMLTRCEPPYPAD